MDHLRNSFYCTHVVKQTGLSRVSLIAPKCSNTDRKIVFLNPANPISYI